MLHFLISPSNLTWLSMKMRLFITLILKKRKGSLGFQGHSNGFNLGQPDSKASTLEPSASCPLEVEKKAKWAPHSQPGGMWDAFVEERYFCITTLFTTAFDLGWSEQTVTISKGKRRARNSYLACIWKCWHSTLRHSDFILKGWGTVKDEWLKWSLWWLWGGWAGKVEAVKSDQVW